MIVTDILFKAKCKDKDMWVEKPHEIGERVITKRSARKQMM